MMPSLRMTGEPELPPEIPEPSRFSECRKLAVDTPEQAKAGVSSS